METPLIQCKWHVLVHNHLLKVPCWDVGRRKGMCSEALPPSRSSFAALPALRCENTGICPALCLTQNRHFISLKGWIKLLTTNQTPLLIDSKESQSTNEQRREGNREGYVGEGHRSSFTTPPFLILWPVVVHIPPEEWLKTVTQAAWGCTQTLQAPSLSSG